MLETSFAENLKGMRLSLGLTQEDAGTATGISPAAISHYETGRREPSLKNIVRLCKGFNCTPNRLIFSSEFRGWDHI